MDCECHSVAAFEIICSAFPAGQRSRNFKAAGLLFTPIMAGKLSGNWKTDGEKGLGGRTLAGTMAEDGALLSQEDFLGEELENDGRYCS